jgi:cytochrome c-type protein NapC
MSMNKNAFLQRLKAIGLPMIGLIFLAGILFWGAFNTVMEWTNKETFCISCHEMRDNVFQEYRNTIHYSNRTGVRATCADCHVPKEWTPKIIRKIQASNELLHHLFGSVGTPEKFNAKRLKLAQSEWDRMKKSDSRECRNCHSYDYMDFGEEGQRASMMHQQGFAKGETCIDCHKGISHTLPPIEQDIGAEKGGARITSAATPPPADTAGTPPPAVPTAQK